MKKKKGSPAPASKASEIKIVHIKASQLKPAEYNPRKWSESQESNIKDSIQRFGLVDPIICNCAPARKDIVIGGHFRLKVAKQLGIKTVPVVYVNIPDLKLEKELNLRLNKNLGEWDFEILAQFEKEILETAGFSKEELELLATEINPDIIDNIDIAEAGQGFRQMTFVVSSSQAEIIGSAIEQIKKEVKPEYADNENQNGNALYYMARKYQDELKK